MKNYNKKDLANKVECCNEFQENWKKKMVIASGADNYWFLRKLFLQKPVILKDMVTKSWSGRQERAPDWGPENLSPSLALMLRSHMTS